MIDCAGERWFVHGLFRDSGVVVGDSFLYVWFFDHIGVFVVGDFALLRWGEFVWFLFCGCVLIHGW